MIYKMNRFGHLHIWHMGTVKELSDCSDNPKLAGRESDEYHQDSQDVNRVLAFMGLEDRRDVEEGWTVSA